MDTKDIILELRTRNGLSQDELAEKIYVTRQAVSRWENGETIPNTETLKLLSKFFDVSDQYAFRISEKAHLPVLRYASSMTRQSVKRKMVLSMKNTANGAIRRESLPTTTLTICLTFVLNTWQMKIGLRNKCGYIWQICAEVELWKHSHK